MELLRFREQRRKLSIDSQSLQQSRIAQQGQGKPDSSGRRRRGGGEGFNPLPSKDVIRLGAKESVFPPPEMLSTQGEWRRGGLDEGARVRGGEIIWRKEGERDVGRRGGEGRHLPPLHLGGPVR
jgi:hypothetical protein